MSARLLMLRQAVIDQITSALPKGWDVAGHLGRFSPADLNTFMLKAPAVRVAVLALSDSRTVDAGAIQTRARIGVYVLTKDGVERLGREQVAAAAVETIVLSAMATRWGLDFCLDAEPANAQAIFNETTVAKGVALWAIDIAQPILLERPEMGEPGPVSEIYLGLAPNIGPDHINDYVGPFVAAGNLPESVEP